MSNKYNFDNPADRTGTGSLKWDVKDGELPMWVADMDFETAPEIKDALKKRAEHGIYGYSVVTDEWYDAYTGWWKKRHNFTIETDWLIFATGVVPILSSVVRKLTTPGENVLVQTPVYNIFFNSIVNNGRNVVENKLIYENKRYHIDFKDLEEKLANPQTTMMFLCNPHNPAGIVWDKETLERIGNLCYENNVIVVSDEIHCDLTYPGLEYTPFASVSEICRKNSISCFAPTKAFNMAGIQTAAACVPDNFLRHKVNRGLNTDEVAEPNFFAVSAAVAAFSHGEQWLESLREYLDGNKKAVIDFIEKEIPAISVVNSDATYLLWLDISAVSDDSAYTAEFIREKTGLYLSAGEQFGGDGRYFLRMNIACPRERIYDGLNRLKNGINKMMIYNNSASHS